MKPPFAYFGGKSTIADRIVAAMPPHRIYVEPFFGSGAVFFAKPPTPLEILNDLDDALVTFFRVLRERPEDLERACRLTPYARTEYEQAVYDPSLDDLETARRFWVRINQSFNKAGHSHSGWSITVARTQAVSVSVRGRIARFAACADRLQRAAIECCDAVALVERCAQPDALIYADPPYPAAGRSSRVAGGGVGEYRAEMGDEEDHRRLAEVLRSTPAAVMVSSYPSPLYDELYKDWWRLDIEMTLRSANAHKSPRRPLVEAVWMNREPRHAPGRFDLREARRG